MDDLDRLFRFLVRRLSDAGPERLRTPFHVSELYQTLVPYRTHKRELGFDAIEDYEMAILRLLAGERGYAEVEPEDVQESLAAEAESVNPNPSAFREYAAARVILNVNPMRSVLDEHAAYAPPGYRDTTPEPAIEEAATAPEPPEAPAAPTPVPEPVEPSAPPVDVPARRPIPPGEPRSLVFEPVEVEDRCSGCDEVLPPHRTVVFCPYCGRRIGETRCPACGEEMEPEWRFCLRCGTAAHD
jgi:hypothetical protein